MFRLKPIVIITHKDLDGVAGAALYIYCKNIDKDTYKVVFIEPNNFMSTFRKYYKKGRNYVVIDIGLNDKVYHELKQIDLSSVHIEWYDHHVWESEWIEMLRTKNIEINLDRKFCATGVVAEHVCKKTTDIVKNFVESVCSADLWKFDRYESTFLFRYSDMYSSKQWYQNLLELFLTYLRSEISDLIKYIEDEVAKYVDEELEVLSSLNKKIVKINLNTISLCIYVKTKHIPSSSIIGNTILSKCDIAIIINESLKSISFRSSKCNVREIAKLFNGGGHLRAAGASLTIPPIYKILKITGIGNNLVKDIIVNEVLKKISKNNISWEQLCVSV